MKIKKLRPGLFLMNHSIGPALGSGLYQLGGFSLPFFSVGGFTLLVDLFFTLQA